LVEVIAVAGPLDEDRLRWIAELYGAVDAKYRDHAQLEHLFVSSPAGPALHAFALDGSRPVGHCAVVPMTARRDGAALLVGKVEALVVEAAYRGRRAGEPPLAMSMREHLYAAADARGVEVLHAYVRPEVGRILDLTPVRVAPRSLVAVLRPGGVASNLRLPATAVAAMQLVLRGVARPFAGPSGVSVRQPEQADVDLVRAPSEPPGKWTIRAEDAWDWCRAAPALRVVTTADPPGARVLVQLPGDRGDALRVIAWRSERQGLTQAIRVALASLGLARQSGAARVVYQPWPDDARGRALAHACRMLGFVERDDFATLYVRGRDPALARSVATTPLLALGF
jgi:GNAT superfamily N-acetyltransferase